MSEQDLVFWVWFLLALMPIFAATGWLIGGVRRRRAPKPLPGLWWLCPACRSVNAPDRPACYSCGRPIPAQPLTLPTARDFEVTQRFGPERPIDEIGRPVAAVGLDRPPVPPTSPSTPPLARRPSPPAPRPDPDRPASP